MTTLTLIIGALLGQAAIVALMRMINREPASMPAVIAGPKADEPPSAEV